MKSFWEFVSKKFKDVDEIHFFDYACSNGLETYSFLLGLDAYCEEKDIKKIKQIEARDYDPVAINVALLRYLNITDLEMYNMDNKILPIFNKNFNPINIGQNNYRVADSYFSKVNFEIGDITQDYKNLPKENVILSIRNCWPYFTKENQLYLPEKLCNHFDKNALILIGSFDFRTQQSKDFLKNGFKKAKVKTNGAVFEK